MNQHIDICAELQKTMVYALWFPYNSSASRVIY